PKNRRMLEVVLPSPVLIPSARSQGAAGCPEAPRVDRAQACAWFLDVLARQTPGPEGHSHEPDISFPSLPTVGRSQGFVAAAGGRNVNGKLKRPCLHARHRATRLFRETRDNARRLVFNGS